MNKLAVFIIVQYQRWVSPWLGSCCRYYPSCSEYSKQAFQKKSLFRAFFLSLKRLLSCNPFFRGGVDVVK